MNVVKKSLLILGIFLAGQTSWLMSMEPSSLDEEEFTVIGEEPSLEEEFEEISQEQKAILNQDEVLGFSTYYDSRVYKEYIIDQVIKGGSYVYELLRGNSNAVPKSTPQQWLESIVSVLWYLFAEAVNKGEAFDEGTFVLHDPNFRIYDFLANYLIARDKSTPRISSHFNHYYKYKKAKLDQFGIDVDIPNLLLPVKKAHILFGKVDEERKLIFIKLENAGLEDVMSFIQHAWEFLHAQIRKKHDAFWSWMETSFGKEWITDTFVETAKEVIGTDDDPSWRKERVPWFVLTNYISLIYQIPQTVKDNAAKKTMIERATVLGIQEIVDTLGELAMNIEDQALQNTIVTFVGQLNAAYDHNDMRFGREVILTEADMRETAHFYNELMKVGLDKLRQQKEKLEHHLQQKRSAILQAQERRQVPAFMRSRKFEGRHA